MSDEVAGYSPQENDAFQRHGRLEAGPAQTEVVVLSSKDSFRHAARSLPRRDDAILEIGCSTGEATRALARTGARVVAVDKAPEPVARLAAELAGDPHVVVAGVDGRNIPALVALIAAPTVIFIDIGGDATLDAVALQVRLCLRAFRPRLVVVRSFELATLAALIGHVEPPALSGLLPVDPLHGREHLSNLLDLSASTSTDTRCFAARCLGRLEDPAARQRLREMARDPHPKVRRAAQRATEDLGGDA